MIDLNMQFVREFFELNLFRVLTHWQHQEAQARSSDPGPLLFVEHARPGDGDATSPVASVDGLPFLLPPNEVPLIRRAVVEVRAWHGERFYSSVIASSSALSHVVGSETTDLANEVFGTSEFATILVISELPTSSKPRNRSLELLKGLGIGHVLEFPALLQEMIVRVSAHGNYAPSQTLQTLRLLKRYNLIRLQQLEFAFKGEAPEAAPGAPVHAEVVAEEGEEEEED